MNKINPVCCGTPSVEVVQSVNLKYYFCKTCKNEVTKDNTDTDFFKVSPCHYIPIRLDGYSGTGMSIQEAVDSLLKNIRDDWNKYPSGPPKIIEDAPDADLLDDLDEDYDDGMLITTSYDHPTGHRFGYKLGDTKSYCVKCNLVVEEAQIIPRKCPGKV